MKFTAGELYVIGEIDLRTKQKTNYYKVGIVREKKERTSAERLKDHQTGNPRELFVHDFIKCQVVEEVETVFHRLMAPKGVRGEWLELNDQELSDAIALINRLNQDVNAEYAFFERAENLKKQVSSEDTINPNDEIIIWHKKYAEADVRSKAAGRVLKVISEVLKEAAASGVELDYIVEIQIKEGRKTLDREILKSKFPDIYTRYLRIEESLKQRFTVTIPKEIKGALENIDAELFATEQTLNEFVENLKAGKKTYKELHGLYLDILSVEAEADWVKTISEARLKSACSESAGIEGICSWPRSIESKESFDEKLFREEYPELAEKFTQISEPVEAVLVNPKRGY